MDARGLLSARFTHLFNNVSYLASPLTKGKLRMVSAHRHREIHAFKSSLLLQEAIERKWLMLECALENGVSIKYYWSRIFYGKFCSLVSILIFGL